MKAESVPIVMSLLICYSGTIFLTIVISANNATGDSSEAPMQ